jgi:succinate dehydrogenase / fumarate reductase membrane anchor subunit
MAMRTPLKRVRSLGAAGVGTDHFWMMRLTSVALLFLTVFLVGLIVAVAGADYASVKETLGHPIVALLLLLLVVANAEHMRLGMQEIIVDYVHSEGAKVALLMLNTFFSIVVGLISVWAVLRLSFGV